MPRHPEMSGFSAGYFPKTGCHYNQATVLQCPKASSRRPSPESLQRSDAMIGTSRFDHVNSPQSKKPESLPASFVRSLSSLAGSERWRAREISLVADPDPQARVSEFGNRGVLRRFCASGCSANSHFLRIGVCRLHIADSYYERLLRARRAYQCELLRQGSL